MIIPAMDLLQNRVVRLYQGDYKKTQFYDIDPLELVRGYQAEGAEVIHIIDLEGARNAAARQLDLISEVVKATGARFQVGGGVRAESDVAELLDIGVERVIIGSLAINEPEKVNSWIQSYGKDQIVLALDVSIDADGNRWLPTKGWQSASGQRLEDVLAAYTDIQHVLCTDISRDGTLKGSNTVLYEEVVKVYSSIAWQASGGIGSLSNVKDVAGTGASGVIVGKALLDGIFTLKEAQICWQNA